MLALIWAAPTTTTRHLNLPAKLKGEVVVRSDFDCALLLPVLVLLGKLPFGLMLKLRDFKVALYQ